MSGHEHSSASPDDPASDGRTGLDAFAGLIPIDVVEGELVPRRGPRG